MAPSDCNHLEHTMHCEILHPIVWGVECHSCFAMFQKTSHHRIIMKFQELSPLTGVMSMQKIKIKGKGHRGETMLSHFRTKTQVFFNSHMALSRWNDAQRLIWHRRDALSFVNVIHQISRLHIVPAKVLASLICSTPATMVLAMQDAQVLVFHKDEFQLTVFDSCLLLFLPVYVLLLCSAKSPRWGRNTSTVLPQPKEKWATPQFGGLWWLLNHVNGLPLLLLVSR